MGSIATTGWGLVVRTFGGTVSVIKDLDYDMAVSVRETLLKSSEGKMDYHGYSNRQGSALPCHMLDGTTTYTYFATADDVRTVELIPPPKSS